jgi:hypothetical protein
LGTTWRRARTSVQTGQGLPLPTAVEAIMRTTARDALWAGLTSPAAILPVKISAIKVSPVEIRALTVAPVPTQYFRKVDVT